MPIIVFIVIGSVGLTTTKILLKIIHQRDEYSNQLHALTVAFGLGITWWFTFLCPVAVANNFKIEFELFVLIFFVSVSVWGMAYIIDLILVTHLRKK